MSISTEIQYTDIDSLYLDPKNPRLGRHNIRHNLDQDDILELVRKWTLDELAYSYLESGGYWAHEALIVVEEVLSDDELSRLVVVEGNRRLAALKYLLKAFQGEPVSQKWSEIIDNYPEPDDLFSRVPYVEADSREDVQTFLGFRHVTGIKQWDADEKAAFIANLIEEQNLSYEQVMRKIGSKTPTVRVHYIAYRTLLQIEEFVEDFDPQVAEDRFTVLRMSLRTQGARDYLEIDIYADPETAKRPVPEEKLEELTNFARWLFGTEDIRPLVRDTRQVSDFGKILQSDEAIEYLERTRKPNFEIAFRTAGGDEDEIVRLVQQARDNIELALTRAHHFKDSTDLKKAVQQLGIDVFQILSLFPDIKTELLEEQE